MIILAQTYFILILILFEILEHMHIIFFCYTTINNNKNNISKPKSLVGGMLTIIIIVVTLAEIWLESLSRQLFFTFSVFYNYEPCPIKWLLVRASGHQRLLISSSTHLPMSPYWIYVAAKMVNREIRNELPHPLIKNMQPGSTVWLHYSCCSVSLHSLNHPKVENTLIDYFGEQRAY